MGSTRHNSQLYIPLRSITLARFVQFLPIDKILPKLKFHQHSVVIPTKAGANATAQGEPALSLPKGICCFHPAQPPFWTPKTKGATKGRAFAIFTLYIQNIKSEGVKASQTTTLYSPSFLHLSRIRTISAY
jgi:hypothetical protein